MRTSSSFAGGIVFAALAAALWLPCAVLVGPVVGVRGALGLYLAGAAAAYVGTLTVGARRPIAACLAFVASGAVALLAQSPVEIAVGLTVIVGVARALLYPTAPARMVLRESLLLIAGLVVARILAAPSLVSIALALWGFLLVQSFFFLGGGGRVVARTEGDAFEEARRRTLSLLER